MMAPPLQHEATDLPDVVVLTGGGAVVAGVIEVDLTTGIFRAVRVNQSLRRDEAGLSTTSAGEALSYLVRDQ